MTEPPNEVAIRVVPCLSRVINERKVLICPAHQRHIVYRIGSNRSECKVPSREVLNRLGWRGMNAAFGNLVASSTHTLRSVDEANLRQQDGPEAPPSAKAPGTYHITHLEMFS